MKSPCSLYTFNHLSNTARLLILYLAQIDSLESAPDKYSVTADSATTSHDDTADESPQDYGYGFMAVITSINAENHTITVDFIEENQFFSDIIEINYDTLFGAEPFATFAVNDEIEVLVSVNDIAEISSIRKK